MLCIKCKKEIPDGSLFCMFCGKKQTVTKAKYHKREHGTGSITRDKRNHKSPWVAHAPANREGRGRVYIGAFATRAEAQAAIDDYIKCGCPDLPNATLKDIFDLWHEAHSKDVGDAAMRSYDSVWNRFSEIRDIPMKDIRTVHFQKIVDTAATIGTANKIRTVCSMLSKYAMENDVIQKNYASFIRIPKFAKKEKRIFSADEIKILWEHSDNADIQAILILIYTGFRIGELLSIKKSDIHLEEGYIVGGEKTEAGKNRIVPIPPNIPEIKDFLVSRIEQAKGERAFSMNDRDFRDNVFYASIAELGMISAHREKNRWVFDDKNHLTPHSTRHTFASLSAAAGMHPENLQKIIGHANYSTTAEIYIHQDIETLKSEMSKLMR